MKSDQFKKLLAEFQTKLPSWEAKLEHIKSSLKATAGELEGAIVVAQEGLPLAINDWALAVLLGAEPDYSAVTQIRQAIDQKKEMLADLDSAWKYLRTWKADLDTFKRCLSQTQGHLKKFEIALIEVSKLKKQCAIDSDLSEQAAEAKDELAWLDDEINFQLDEAERLLEAAEKLGLVKKGKPKK